MKPSISIVVLCSWLVAGPVSALLPDRELHQYAHRQWRIDEGLPQNTVRAIAQTPDGMLWVGTQGGLARFDGFDFDIVRDRFGILDRHHAYTLRVDRRGGLWVGTSGGGLLRYDAGRFERIDSIDARQVLALEPDGDTLWIGTENAGVLRLDPDGTVTSWGGEHGVVGGIHDLALDGSGGVYVPTAGSGLHHVDAAGAVTAVAAASMPSPLAWTVERDGDAVWVGTTRGLVCLEGGEVIESFTEDDLEIPWVRQLLIDRDGTLWLGTVAGLVRARRSRGGWSFEALSSRTEANREIVWEIAEDAEGAIWFGTLGSGLHQVLATPAITYSTPDGLAGHRPLAVLPAPDGSLDVATRGGGVLALRDGRFTPHAGDWARVDAWSLDRDADGGLWMATMVPSLDHVVDGRLHRRYTAADGLGRGRVLTVLVDAVGDVWVATSSGLARVRDGQVRAFTTADGLVHDSVLTVESGADGRIWAGTRDGVSIWDGEAFTNLVADPERGLRNGSIWSILPRADGSAWVGTFGGGLHRVVDARVTGVVTVVDGLPSNDITSLVVDPGGTLWMSTTRGLARVELAVLDAYLDGERETLPVRTIDSRHGLSSAEFFGGQPIGIWHDGALWFVHLGGITRIDPRRLRDHAAPAVVFNRVGVDGVPVEWRDGPIVELGPGPHTLDFRWAAATLDAPERHRFHYRLAGFEQQWSTAGRDRSIRYTNVGSGRYTFQVQASNDRGELNGEIASVALAVAPRFTETGTFYALVAAAFVALGFGVQQIRVRRLRHRQEELRQVAEEAVANVRTLRGLLPMCASCKKIRDDAGYWNQIEVYLDHHSEVELSHGLCPDCSERTWSELENVAPAGS